MNVLEIIDALKGGLMWACLGVLLLIAAACALVGLRRVSRVICRLNPAVLAVFAVAAIFATGLAQKRMLQDGGSGIPALPSITADVIAQGWRVESVVTNDAISYTMPTNGVEYLPWSLRGGRETHFPLDLGDFAFPFGTGMVHRLDVLSGGMVESFPRPSCMSICAAREWASIVPGVGRFWWADAARPESAPYRSKLLTWENVFAGRDCTGQYNAQIELWSDGNFVTRSNNVERICRRVLPFDFDNDGLPNDIDPAPETPLVPSAWNQSEEWAAAAFPSNAADIAAMGGYAAWVAAHGTEPDRRLVSLGVSFDDGSAWPALLEFGGVPVVADGGEQLAFAIDCGAKVHFSLTAGRLVSVEVTAASPPMRSGEGMTTTESSEFQGNYGYPHERTVNDVKVHLDGPRSGWLCRIAGVSVDDDLAHLHPGDSAVLTAEVSDCHSNADEIQPRFVLPVVIPRTIPIRAFVVETPKRHVKDQWEIQEIKTMLDTANEIFMQVGIRFELEGPPTTVGTTNDWNLTIGMFKDNNGTSRWEYASACTNLLNSYTASDCIEIYFTGSVVYHRGSLAATTPYGIVVGKRKVKQTTLAHEFGHALGLDDCYARMKNGYIGGLVSVIHADDPVDGPFFDNGTGDWGRERGRGFYTTEDSKLAVAGRLLMHGFSSDDRVDIPTGRVKSHQRFRHWNSGYVLVQGRGISHQETN